MKAIRLLLCLFLLSIPLFATDYYVKNGGNDGLDGLSDGNAWATIAKVNAEMGNFNPGDTISFKRGSTFNDADLTITCDGTAGNPITFGDYGSGALPIISERKVKCSTANISYIIVEYLNIKDYVTGSNAGVVFNGDNSDNIILRYLTISNMSLSGIYISKCNTYEISNCTISNVTDCITVIGSLSYAITNGIIKDNDVSGATSGDGIVLHGGGDGGGCGPTHLIQDNVSYDNSEQGIDVWADSVTIVGNETYGNNTGGIVVGATAPDFSTNILIYNNYVHDEDDEGILVGRQDNSTIHHNIIYDWASKGIYFYSTAGDDIEIFNNTLVAGTSSGIHVVIGDDYTNLNFQNNIFSGTNSGSPASYVDYSGSNTPVSAFHSWDYNIYWNPENDNTQTRWNGKNWADWKADYSEDANSTYDNPDLVEDSWDADTDFKITTVSPGKDGGVNVGLGTCYFSITIPSGASPDIGAHEYDQGVNPHKAVLKSGVKAILKSGVKWVIK